MSVIVVRHPVVDHYLTVLRDTRTGAEGFRHACEVTTRYLVARAAEHLATETLPVETPLEPVDGRRLQGETVLVPILRAGLGMLHAAAGMLPRVTVGYIGLERDESTAVARCYYTRMPQLEGRDVFLLDPMLATGGSANHAIAHLKETGAGSVVMVSIIAAPEGVAAVEAAHPDTVIVTGCVDRELDDNKYIRPGLGDFGDRLYGT